MAPPRDTNSKMRPGQRERLLRSPAEDGGGGYGAVGGAPDGPHGVRPPPGKRIRTVWVAALQAVLVAGVVVQAWGGWLKESRLRYVLVHSSMFVVFSVVYAAVRVEHKRVQQLGYHSLYARANTLARAVFFVVAASTVAASCVYVFWPDPDDLDGAVTRDDALNAGLTVEGVALLGLLGAYAALCVAHNRDPSPPDADAIDALPAGLEGQGLAASGSPMSPRGAPQTALMRKQARMITFLEEKVQTLTREVARVGRGGGSGGGGDAEAPPSSLRVDTQPVDIPAGSPPSGAFASLGAGSAPGAGSVAERERERLALQLHELEQESRALRVERDRMQTDLERAREDFDEFERVHAEVRDERDRAQAQVQDLKGTVSRQAQEVSRLVQLLEAKKSEVRALQRERDAGEAGGADDEVEPGGRSV